jgi:hypothetical protein
MSEKREKEFVGDWANDEKRANVKKGKEPLVRGPFPC